MKACTEDIQGSEGMKKRSKRTRVEDVICSFVMHNRVHYFMSPCGWDRFAEGLASTSSLYPCHRHPPSCFPSPPSS
jgi:hypothetical protein